MFLSIKVESEEFKWMYLYNYRRLIKGKVTLGKDVQCKKVVKIIEENIYNSTLEIWCKKEIQPV